MKTHDMETINNNQAGCPIPSSGLVGKILGKVMMKYWNEPLGLVFFHVFSIYF